MDCPVSKKYFFFLFKILIINFKGTVLREMRQKINNNSNRTQMGLKRI